MAIRKISFQGAKGANSEIAIHEVYGDEVEAVPCDTFEDAFNSLNKGEVDLAMIPIENTLAAGLPIFITFCQNPVPILSVSISCPYGLT